MTIPRAKITGPVLKFVLTNSTDLSHESYSSVIVYNSNLENL